MRRVHAFGVPDSYDAPFQPWVLEHLFFDHVNPDPLNVREHKHTHKFKNSWGSHKTHVSLLPDVLRHPLFGNGISSILWSEAMRRGAGAQVLAVTHPHNAYLEALLDTGVVGTVLLCSYFAHVWRRMRVVVRQADVDPLLRGFYLGASAGLIAMLVSDFTDSSLVPRPEQAFLWLAVGMMYGEYARRAAVARAERPRAPAPAPADAVSVTTQGAA